MACTERESVASGRRSIRALEAVPTVETALFVASRVPRRTHILEIGCGNGELAALLGRVGFRVTAIDASVESVRSAGAMGVDVRQARWPDFEGGPYDAVLFARSLHHMQDLRAALERSRDLLTPAGILLVEDFAREALEPVSARWVLDGIRRCARAGLVRHNDSFAAEVAAAEDDDRIVLEAWNRRHGDDLHTSLAMDRAMRKVFDAPRSIRCPYLYRYLVSGLTRDRAGFLALREWLACEHAAILDGDLAPVGRRFVASNTQLS